MKIRSATLGIPLAWPPSSRAVENAGRGLGAARTRFTAAGWTVQTTRLALPPFPEVLGWREPVRVRALAHWLAGRCAAAEIDYASLGPVSAAAPPDAAAPPLAFVDALVGALVAHDSIFGTVRLDTDDGVDPPMAEAAARAIVALGQQTPDGFGNLRFAALARCPAGIPFFPAAYHDGGPPSLALALEGADLALAAFDGAPTIAAAQERLTSALEAEGNRLAAIGAALCAERGWRFGGLDLSLAPFPDTATSIATALERLGLGRFGGFGTVYAARCLTSALERARLPRCGFSGLMLPVLEDTGLAAAAAAGQLRVNDLLLYSTVCGTGLDTVPLPGDTSAAEITGMLLDLATLAVTLDKPLTARLMPVPGRVAGTPTAYDFPYFANTAVLPVPAAPPLDLLRRARTEGPTS
jgi:uncharacterized protein (UPF0210 family)